MRLFKNVFFLLLAGCMTKSAFAFEIQDVLFEAPRAKLEEKGLSFEAVYIGDIVSNLQG